MNDEWPTSELDALRSILEEAHAILEDLQLPQGRAQRCFELISSARAIADDMKKKPTSEAATLGSKGGKRTLSKLGPDHFRKLAALRKTRGGGRPKSNN